MHEVRDVHLPQLHHQTSLAVVFHLPGSNQNHRDSQINEERRDGCPRSVYQLHRCPGPLERRHEGSVLSVVRDTHLPLMHGNGPPALLQPRRHTCRGSPTPPPSHPPILAEQYVSDPADGSTNGRAKGPFRCGQFCAVRGGMGSHRIICSGEPEEPFRGDLCVSGSDLYHVGEGMQREEPVNRGVPLLRCVREVRRWFAPEMVSHL